jgi:hypothetical protein
LFSPFFASKRRDKEDVELQEWCGERLWDWLGAASGWHQWDLRKKIDDHKWLHGAVPGGGIEPTTRYSQK